MEFVINDKESLKVLEWDDCESILRNNIYDYPSLLAVLCRKVTGVKVQPIDWKPNPEGGRPIMVEAGEPEIIKAELVLLAMGFLKPEHPEYPANVFVCGDAANGASLVVRAIASGKQTAEKVNAFLKK